MMRSFLVMLALIAMPATIADAANLPGTAPLTSAFTKQLVKEALQEHDSRGAFDVVVDLPRLPMGNQEVAPTEVVVEGFRFDEQTGHFKAMLVGTVGSAPRFHLPLEGRLRPMVSVAVLSRAVARGEHISAEDLDWIETSPNDLSDDALLDPEMIIGTEARRRLGPGRVLTNRDVGPPRLVRRGQPVRVVYADGGLQLTSIGKARDDGAFGEPIRVVNPDSNLQIQGIATGPSEVTVGRSVMPGAGY